MATKIQLKNKAKLRKHLEALFTIQNNIETICRKLCHAEKITKKQRADEWESIIDNTGAICGIIEKMSNHKVYEEIQSAFHGGK